MTVSLLSCRSVKTAGSVATYHYSNGTDTLATISISERVDSSSYFHGLIDSLSSELVNIQKAFRDIYAKDSVNEVQRSKDRESIKDSTWMQINPDGSVTYHHYREKIVHSLQLLDRYKQQKVKESMATTDSIIDRNKHLQAQCDSMSVFRGLIDSVSVYKAKADSLSRIINEYEKETVVMNGVWDKIKASIMTAAFLIFMLVLLYVYIRFFHR